MAENGTLTKQQLKAKIRERYRGVDPNILEGLLVKSYHEGGVW